METKTPRTMNPLVLLIPFAVLGMVELRNHLVGGDALRPWLLRVEIEPGAEQALQRNARWSYGHESVDSAMARINSGSRR